MKKAIKKVLLLQLCLLILATPALAGDVTVSVAASLKDVIHELSMNYGKNHPGVKIMENYGASGALAKQIANGAPADIYISANPEWMSYLKNNRLVEAASIGTFAYNSLVFAGAANLRINSLQDIVRLDKIAIGSPKSVPAGEYAMDALRKDGIDKLLANKLVMARDVRECLMYAERGEVDGAFVYKTDALLAKRTKILFTVPQDLYPRVTYPLALTLSGAGNKDAESFRTYLLSAEAKAVLGKYGFAIR
jgi:molybdate transport system substrate-binding protein